MTPISHKIYSLYLLIQSTLKADSLREKKKAQARARILACANQLIRSHGYAKTTMREIAASAEISYQTLYNYYPTKGEILFQLLKAQVEDISAEYANLLQSFEGGLLEALDGLCRLALAALTGDDRTLWRIALTELLNQDQRADNVLELIDTVAREALEDLLRSARDTGELSSAASIPLLAATLYDLMDYAAVRLLFDPEARLSESLENLAARLRVVVSPYLMPEINTQ